MGAEVNVLSFLREFPANFLPFLLPHVQVKLHEVDVSCQQLQT